MGEQPASDAKGSREEDLLFGKLLIEKKYVTPEQVKECLKIRAGNPQDSQGRPLRLGEILMRRGYVTMEALEEVIRSRTTPATAASSTVGKTSTFENPGQAPAEVAKAALDPKKRLGKYVLLKIVGRGGMGAVYKAWDTVLNRAVAVKMLTGDSSPQDIQRFLREAQTAGSLMHPNITAMYDLGEEEGRPYLVMQFIEGKNASDLKMTIERSVEVARIAALALHQAHLKGIVHRDVKPSNLMVDGKGEVFVMDFGIARQKNQSDLTRTGVALGTPSFMSPEQAQSKPLTAKSDIYSLGATLYEFVTGRPPFSGSTPLQTIMHVVNKDAAPPSSINRAVPRGLELVILKCLEKDPAARYASARELAEDLDRFLKGEPVHAQPPTFWTGFTKRFRRNRALAPLAALVLVGILAVAYFAATSSNRSGHAQQAVLKADALFQAKRYPDALEAYNQAMALDPGDSRIPKRIQECRKIIDALALEQLRQKEELERKRKEEEAKLRRAQSAAPELAKAKEILEQAERDLYRPSADLELSRQRCTAALEHVDRAIKDAPDLGEAYYYRGRIHQFRLDRDKAEADYGKAIELMPGHTAALAARGRLRITRYSDMMTDGGGAQGLSGTRANEMEALKKGAEEDFSAAAKSAREGQDAVYLAHLRYSAGDYVGAVAAAKGVLDKDDTNEELWRLCGDAHFYSVRVDEYARFDLESAPTFKAALACWDKALALRVNFPEVLAMKGHMYRLLRRREDAIQNLEAALKIDRRSWLAYVVLANVVDETGKPEDFQRSIQLFTKAIEIWPGSFMARVNRASALGRVRRFEEALADLEAAEKLIPNHFFSLQLKGAMLAQVGKDAEAEVALTLALGMNDTMPAVWYNRGAVRIKQQKIPEALSDFEMAIRKGHPESAYIRSIIEKYR